MLVTEWHEFRRPSFERLKSLMKQPVLFDGRNVWSPAEVRAAGFTYYGIGRGKAGAREQRRLCPAARLRARAITTLPVSGGEIGIAARSRVGAGRRARGGRGDCRSPSAGATLACATSRGNVRRDGRRRGWVAS